MSTSPITYNTAMEIGSHEAVIRQAYKDSGNVWTWSVGLTSATGHVVDRYIGKPQSMDHCLRVYVWALDNYADTVRKVFEGFPLTEAQFAAALSFHWNTGQITKAGWVKHFKAGKMAEAERSFKSWNKDNGKVVEGLKKRRALEAGLLFRGEWSNRGAITEYTRLTASGHPDFKSGRKVNVEQALRDAISGRIPASDKIIVEAAAPPPTAAVAISSGGAGTGAILAAEPVAKAVEALTTQQGELTSGDYVRIAVALVIVVGSIWYAWRSHKGSVGSPA